MARHGETTSECGKIKGKYLSHHTSAEDVVRVASAAKVKALVLTHFVPADDKSLSEQVWKNAVKRTFPGSIIFGKDLLQIAL